MPNQYGYKTFEERMAERAAKTNKPNAQPVKDEAAPPRRVGRPPRIDRTRNVLFAINEFLLDQVDEILHQTKTQERNWRPTLTPEQSAEADRLARTQGVAAANLYLASVQKRPKATSRNALLNELVEEALLARNRDDNQVREPESPETV